MSGIEWRASDPPSPFFVRHADALYRACEEAIQAGRIDARSKIGDAALDYRQERDEMAERSQGMPRKNVLVAKWDDDGNLTTGFVDLDESPNPDAPTDVSQLGDSEPDVPAPTCTTSEAKRRKACADAAVFHLSLAREALRGLNADLADLDGLIADATEASRYYSERKS